VVKPLGGQARREAEVYRRLRRHRPALAPRLLAVARDGGATTLFLERVAARERWPWREPARGEAVLSAAADLHAARVPGAPAWDYERELEGAAHATLDALLAARRGGAHPVDAASLRAVRRVVAALAAVRRELLRGGPFAPTLIHGDLHPGNVVLCFRGGAPVPVLLDWGRARLGSPMEDVASFIQSLGCWEPAARARHDSLLAAYLRARGAAGAIPPAAREACWLAGASNGLAGALAHHLRVATSPSAPARARASAAWAVRDWLRIMRRAEAVWLGPPRAARGARPRRTPRSGGRAGTSRGR
jgi:aminoglycoside phosphotransferase (APT) family kinase protein